MALVRASAAGLVIVVAVISFIADSLAQVGDMTPACVDDICVTVPGSCVVITATPENSQPTTSVSCATDAKQPKCHPHLVHYELVGKMTGGSGSIDHGMSCGSDVVGCTTTSVGDSCEADIWYGEGALGCTAVRASGTAGGPLYLRRPSFGLPRD